MKYSRMINGIDYIALTKLDVLSGLDRIKVCVGYEYNGRILETFPPEIKILEHCNPIYREFEGWKEDISKAKVYGDLPKNAKYYLDFIKEYLGVKYSLVSVGTDRMETISMNEVF